MSAKESGEDYQTESKKFLAKLFDFHQKNGTTLRRIPTLGGRELDLYHLYKKVESLGGYEVVSQGRMWGEVARSFKLPPSVTSASYAIRQHYVRLLEKFEAYEKDPNFFKSLKAPVSYHAVNTPSSLSSSSSSSPSSVQPRTSLPFLYSKNLIFPSASSPSPSHPTPSITASKDKPNGKNGGYDRLARSLLSGYPNEVDFAFNVLIIMAYKGPSSLPITELPYLLDLILAHVAVFPASDTYDDYGLEALYHHCWHLNSQINYLEFWAVTVPEWVYAAVHSNNYNTSPHQYNGLFASRRELSEMEVEGYRVNQVAAILNNLSLDHKAAEFLSSHNGVLSFLLLANNCCLPEVASTAMDVLVSLVPWISLPSPLGFDSLAELLLHCMLESLLSSDRMIILKGLSVLSQLSWAPPNEDFMENIQEEVWQQLFQLLLLPDIQLVLLCLDTLYQLTAHGSRRATASILQVRRSCEILISLLTLDIRSFGDEALRKIQVVRITQAQTSSSSLSSVAPLKANSEQRFTPTNRKSMVTSLPSMKSSVGVSILNPGGSTPSSGSKTVKIGNCVIPLMPKATSLSQGHSSSPPSRIKGPTSVTIQQIQNLLAKCSGTTTPTPTNLQGFAGGGSTITITGGSNITIHKSTSPLPNSRVSPEPSNSKSVGKTSKSVSNLLRSYLAKNATSPLPSTSATPSPPPFTASTIPYTTATPSPPPSIAVGSPSPYIHASSLSVTSTASTDTVYTPTQNNRTPSPITVTPSPRTTCTTALSSQTDRTPSPVTFTSSPQTSSLPACSNGLHNTSLFIQTNRTPSPVSPQTSSSLAATASSQSNSLHTAALSTQTTRTPSPIIMTPSPQASCDLNSVAISIPSLPTVMVPDSNGFTMSMYKTPSPSVVSTSQMEKPPSPTDGSSMSPSPANDSSSCASNPRTPNNSSGNPSISISAPSPANQSSSSIPNSSQNQTRTPSPANNSSTSTPNPSQMNTPSPANDSPLSTLSPSQMKASSPANDLLVSISNPLSQASDSPVSVLNPLIVRIPSPTNTITPSGSCEDTPISSSLTIRTPSLVQTSSNRSPSPADVTSVNTVITSETNSVLLDTQTSSQIGDENVHIPFTASNIPLQLQTQVPLHTNSTPLSTGVALPQTNTLVLSQSSSTPLLVPSQTCTGLTQSSSAPLNLPAPSLTSTSLPGILSQNCTPSGVLQASKEETFATEWLESNYEECRGSYVSQLEIYSLYLLVTTKTDHHTPLSNTDFNTLLRKVFPNALSTRVSVGNQTVYMMAGLSSKRNLGSLSLRDAITVLAPVSSASANTITQQTMKDSRGPLNTGSTPSTGQTGLSGLRMDYSTQSPLSIASKAASDAEKIGVVTMNGMEVEEDEVLENVGKAKRIKLMGEDMDSVVNSVKEKVNSPSSIVHRTLNTDAGKLSLSAKLERLVAKNHQLMYHAQVERTPSPSFGGSTSYSSPVESRNMSPTPLATPPSHTESSMDRMSVSPAPSDHSLSGADHLEQNRKLCQWSKCNRFYLDSPSLLDHVVHTHLSSLFRSPCLWTGCSSKATRSKPSLLIHIQTCHCNGEAYPPLPSVQKTLARLKAVPQLEKDLENPLTKAVRLTSALILRNMVQCLPEARQDLRKFEQVLCQVAFSESEASTAAAQCLHYLHIPS